MLDEQEIDFQGLPIFSGIDEEEASLFVRQVGGYVQTFSKGARIPYTHGDLPRIGIVLHGLVQVLLTDPTGNEVLAYELEEGAFAKLTPCSKCTTLLRKTQIDEMNRLENPDLY